MSRKMVTVAQFLVVAGMSGAGRSTAAAALEDVGWFVIDNLPPSLMGKVAELVSSPSSETQRVALVIGRGGAEYRDDLGPALESLRHSVGKARVRVLFLDATDDVLVRRFEGTRRRHPLVAKGVVGSIAAERKLLAPIKAQADVVVDTSEMNVHELRNRLVGMFEADDPASLLQINVVSFGYSRGIPLDVDLVLDCRFLTNPHWVEELRPWSGLDQPVREFVLSQPDTKAFLERIDDLLDVVLPGYVKEGKSYLSIAVGCTGGRHRSVVVAEEIAASIRRRRLSATVVHRDVDR